MQHVALDGLWLEFGVSTRGSLAVIAEQTHAHVYGFDSFEGLPEDWYAEMAPRLCREGFQRTPKHDAEQCHAGQGAP